MSLLRQIAGNTAIQVAGKTASTVLGIVTIGLMTRHLGRAGYGQFTTAMTFLQFFGILADFGLTLTLTRLISQAGADERRVTANVFTLRLAVAAAFFGAAPLVALLFPYSGAVRLAIAVGAFSFLAMTLSSLLVAVFQRHLTMRLATIAEVTGRTLLLLLIWWTAATGRGLLAMMAALVAANLVQFLLNFAFARRFVRFGLAFDWPVWKDILIQSWPIGISIAFNLVYLKSDVIILSLFRPDAEVGLYGAAYKVLDVVTVVPTIFMGLVLPILTARWTAGDRPDFARKLGRAFDFMCLLAVPLAVGAWVVGRDLMILVAGNDFAPSGDLLAILMLAGSAVFWSALYGHAVVALGRQRLMIWGYAADAVISLLLYFLLIPRFGAVAAAWVTVFSEVFIAIVTGIAVTRWSSTRPGLAMLGKSLLAAGGMALVLWPLAAWPVAARILIGATVYVIMMYALGGIDRQTLTKLKA
ncbi:hypothetical protein A3C96_02080 [Candidatus Uhrbacteria bacterium RIFCSPHIGHO2_02_FULL_60_10]|uniref:Uncharacterized protein n=1 Tax=Candidatus Uhrbacteria bacterium RIFCSPHIGHO2_02_FULL_60_10 TaxID=1802392 RepID=A0A1F7U7X9_9BACT|nr:MAG: hypothetical protein A3C96_02080 [Candidatus Uhrbacteria bacterium RIFCSPHIGHO2_02_FULL_60_10]